MTLLKPNGEVFWTADACFRFKIALCLTPRALRRPPARTTSPTPPPKTATTSATTPPCSVWTSPPSCYEGPRSYYKNCIILLAVQKAYAFWHRRRLICFSEPFQLTAREKVQLSHQVASLSDEAFRTADANLSSKNPLCRRAV